MFKKKLLYLPRLLWYKFYNWCIRNTSLLFKPGVHLTTGATGSGKTLSHSAIINRINNKKYFFITNIDEFKQENVLHYNVLDLFENGKQIKKLPTKDDKGRKLYGLILEEINFEFNRRMNRTTAYNEKFIGLMQLCVSHRHQGIPRIYFIGQARELQDTQILSVCKYWHDIYYTKPKSYFKLYIEQNKIIMAPKYIEFEHLIKTQKEDYFSLGFEKLKINIEDLKSYNTFGLANVFENMKVLQRADYTKEHREKVKAAKDKK